MAATSTARGQFMTAFRKWLFQRNRYNQMGLLHDDLLNEDIPEVKEALRRLPQKLQDERVYRTLRAVQLDILKNILPQEQWTKFEEDVRYLQPYLDEVLAEVAEKKQWDKL